MVFMVFRLCYLEEKLQSWNKAVKKVTKLKLQEWETNWTFTLLSQTSFLAIRLTFTCEPQSKLKSSVIFIYIALRAIQIAPKRLYGDIQENSRINDGDSAMENQILL